MSLCRDWSIVKLDKERPRARPLYCRSWSCEVCRPKRRGKLFAQCMAGNPTRFITLTVNPSVGSSPEERLRLLAWAWRTTVKRLRRDYPNKELAYLAIVEATKRGEPHLHILFRGPYIPKARLSQCMRELIGAPIVDIQRIKGSKEVISYVAKYITKQPAQFAGSKRYWMTQDYEIHDDTEKERVRALKGGWQVWHMSIGEVERQLIYAGYTRLEWCDDELRMTQGWQLRGLALAEGQYDGSLHPSNVVSERR